MIPLIGVPRATKHMETESTVVVARVVVGGGQREIVQWVETLNNTEQ
jgi:hypothetical protein